MKPAFPVALCLAAWLAVTASEDSEVSEACFAQEAPDAALEMLQRRASETSTLEISKVGKGGKGHKPKVVDPVDPKETVYKLTLNTANVGSSEKDIELFASQVMTAMQEFVEKQSDASLISDDGKSGAFRLNETARLDKIKIKRGRLVEFLDTDESYVKRNSFILRHRWKSDPYGPGSDFALKLRVTGTPVKATWHKMPSNSSLHSVVKQDLKMQYTPGLRDPKYQFYLKFKGGTAVQKLRDALGVNFTDATVAQWVELFPGLANLPGYDAHAKVNNHGVVVEQVSVELGKFGINVGGHKLTNIKPELILWYEKGKNESAITGEITWGRKHKGKTGDFSSLWFGKILFFDELVKDGLQGLVSHGTKTCALYILMSKPC